MNPFLAHFGSGNSLYTGVLLVVGGMALELWNANGRWSSYTSRGLVIIGASGIVGSSIPQPAWLLIGWGISFLAWRFSVNNGRIAGETYRHYARIGFLLVTAVVLFMEIPYAHDPPPLKERPERVTVVGDSLTAGTNRLNRSRLWPRQLERRYGTSVNVIAGPGWKIKNATGWLTAHSLPDNADAIVLLIGGNDVLLDTPTDHFRRELDRLLGQVKIANGPVYMMEIPLTPFGYQYGRIQRQLAQTHNIRLIPKYHLMNVMSGDERTLDGIHLSNRGHQLMARRIHDLLMGGKTTSG